MHHAQCYHIERENKLDIAMLQGYGLARYRKCKIDIVIPRE